MRRAWQAERGARRLKYDDVRAARMAIRVVGRPRPRPVEWQECQRKSSKTRYA